MQGGYEYLDRPTGKVKPAAEFSVLFGMAFPGAGSKAAPCQPFDLDPTMERGTHAMVLGGRESAHDSPALATHR